MMEKTIYLAGPITGLSYKDARGGWRQEFASLMPEHIKCLSPMRGKDALSNETILRGDPNMCYTDPMASVSAILMRDFNDVKNCDVMVACFLGATSISIGTCVEFGFAHALRKPVILVMEHPRLEIPPEDVSLRTNPHEHAFLHQIAGVRVSDLADAARIVSSLLTPGV